jgi:hypothetical protein
MQAYVILIVAVGSEIKGDKHGDSERTKGNQTSV